MAVPPTPTVPNTPLLNVYNDENNANVVTTRLPTGPCNFTNLSAGPNAPKCGCRRFWDQTASSPGVYGFGDGRSQQGTQAGWCMCQHHACFHDTGTEQATELQTGRGSVTRDSVLNQSAALHKALQPGEPQRSRVLGVGHSQSRGTLPDTLEWDRFLNSGPNQAYTGGLPPIPSQCLMPSDTSSIGSASQSRYSRPFGGLGLQTLSQVPRPNIQAQNVSNLDQGRPGNIREKVLYEDSQGRGFLQSLTDVASPSLKCSQTFDNATAFEKNVAGVQAKLQKIADANERNSENNAIVMKPDSPGATDSQEGPTRSATLYDSSDDRHLLLQLRSIVNCVSDYPLKMQNHESRLDCLENASFCNAGIEELQDKHENLDNRVVDLESRVEEVEKAQAAANDASSIGSRRHLDGSFNSMASNTSSAIMAAAVDRVEYRSQIEALQAQVSELQASAVPSYQNPWEVEVVFLPFGSRLMGIWSTSHSLTQRSRSRTNSLPSDDWTQSQHNTMASAQACLTENDQAAAWEHSASDISGQQAWLMPKACGVRSRVDERLRSRGLVKTIQIRGPDARDVQAAMMLAFGDIPMILTGQSSSQYHNSPIPPSLNGFHGLRAPWVPLRKVHKEGILRFLTPSEMVTSALWTVPHLKSSVAMRTSATIRRLYVTQPDSYIQHHRDINAEWTWQKLRELPRVYPDSQSSLEVPEADAQELCWEYDERLDPSPSFHSSFASHHTSLSIRSLQHEEDREPTSPSDHFSSAAVSPALSTTPTSVPATKQLSPIKERHPFHPIHIRPASMSSLVPIKSSPSQAQGLNLSKRRIASFQQETQSSPLKASHTSGLKRRRISQSPTRPQDTPRWSIGPPSPSAFEEITVNERKRGNTPFAYATPHSNAPYVDVSRASPSPSDPSDYYPDDQASLTDDLYQDEEYDVQPYYDSASISDGEAGVTDVDDDMGHQPNEVWDGVQDEIATTGYHSQTGQRGKVLSLLAGRNENENEGDEDDDDAQSDASSQPSEYPSTQQHQDGIFALSTKGVGFRIHVDEEGI